MGAVDLRPPHPRAAQWASSRRVGDPRPARSHLGARIHAFQDDLRGAPGKQHRDRYPDQRSARRASAPGPRGTRTVNAPVIGFAGLTHLGLVSATATAAKGFVVIGVDSDRARVQAIAAGALPVVEPDLDAL